MALPHDFSRIDLVDTRSSVPASSGVRASLIPFIPAFDYRPPNWPAGYEINVAKDRKHDVQRNSASGAKSVE